MIIDRVHKATNRLDKYIPVVQLRIKKKTEQKRFKKLQTQPATYMAKPTQHSETLHSLQHSLWKE